MIKLGTLSKLLTESTHQNNFSQTYICEASMGKIGRETIELIEKLIRSGKTDEALDMIRKVKFDKVSTLGKIWNTLTTPVRKLWSSSKKVAKVATGAAALYGGYKIAQNIVGNDNKKDDSTSSDDKNKQDDKFNQSYDKIISTEPTYVMTKKHGQVFDDDDTKIKTMQDQEDELKQKEKEQQEKEDKQEIKIDLNNIYDEQGNQIQGPYSSPSPNFSFGKFIDKADNAFYDVGQAIGGSLQGGMNAIKDGSVDAYDTFNDVATGEYGSNEEK